MSKDKTTSNQTQENYFGEGLTDIHSSNPEASEVKKIKDMYLPDSKADHKPSEASIESVNGLEHPKPIKPKSLI